MLIEPMPRARSVSVGLWIAAGSRRDPAGREGLAHLLEHLLFKGTPRRGARALAEAMDALGGQFNAFTTRDLTCYHARTLGRRFGDGLALLAEMVAQPRLDAQDLERERQVVLDELAAIEDDPGETAEELLGPALWGAHPIGRPQAGTPQTVRTMAIEELTAFHRRHYVGRQLVVAVAGQVSPDRALAQVAAALGGLPAGAEPEWQERPRPQPRAHRRARRSAQAHVLCATAAPTAVDEGHWATALLASVLGGSPSSRLFQAIREEDGLCYDVGATYNDDVDAGELTVYLATSPAHASAATERALSQVRLLARDGVPQAELLRHRDQLLAGLWMTMEGCESRMVRLGRLATCGLPLVPPSQVAAALRAVRPGQVRAQAAALGDPAAWAAVYVGPAAHAPGVWRWGADGA